MGNRFSLGLLEKIRIGDTSEASLYTIAGLFYLLGMWLHAGGNVYSDIFAVFQHRLCDAVPISACPYGIPYVTVPVEYPVIVSWFMYLMGELGKLFPFYSSQGLMSNYYKYTVIFLVIPTFLLIHETLKTAEILGIKARNRRTLLFLVATPTFIFMLLLNWYVIGVWLAMFGLRKFLQGSRWVSGILLALSAASNLVTALPALGMFLGDDTWKNRIRFALGVGLTYAFLNLPFIAINNSLWLWFWSYHANWYIEGSWMLAFFNPFNQIRHYIFPALFVSLVALIALKNERMRKSVLTQGERAPHVVTLSWYFTFAFLFSTYVSTPQMNLILLPFFVLAPISKHYWEFLAFDVVNSLVIVAGFSEILQVVGITYSFVQFGPIWQSPIQLLAVIRSFWIGKFLLYDGLYRGRKFPTEDLTSHTLTEKPSEI